MSGIGKGKHTVGILSTCLTKSGQKQTPCVAVVFEDEVGDTITYWGYLTDAALEYTMKSLAAMGWDSAKHDGRIDTLDGTDLLVGHKVEIVVDEEEYDGKVRAKVKFVNEIGGGLGERMDPAEASSFAAELRKKILAMGGPKPSTRPAPARKPEPAMAESVIDLDNPPF